jgi:hypothetical protein
MALAFQQAVRSTGANLIRARMGSVGGVLWGSENAIGIYSLGFVKKSGPIVVLLFENRSSCHDK